MRTILRNIHVISDMVLGGEEKDYTAKKRVSIMLTGFSICFPILLMTCAMTDCSYCQTCSVWNCLEVTFNLQIRKVTKVHQFSQQVTFVGSPLAESSPEAIRIYHHLTEELYCFQRSSLLLCRGAVTPSISVSLKWAANIPWQCFQEAWVLHNKDHIFPDDEVLAILVNWGDPFLTLLPSMLVLFLTLFVLVSSLAPGIKLFSIAS